MSFNPGVNNGLCCHSILSVTGFVLILCCSFVVFTLIFCFFLILIKSLQILMKKGRYTWQQIVELYPPCWFDIIIIVDFIISVFAKPQLSSHLLLVCCPKQNGQDRLRDNKHITLKTQVDVHLCHMLCIICVYYGLISHSRHNKHYDSPSHRHAEDVLRWPFQSPCFLTEWRRVTEHWTWPVISRTWTCLHQDSWSKLVFRLTVCVCLYICRLHCLGWSWVIKTCTKLVVANRFFYLFLKPTSW